MPPKKRGSAGGGGGRQKSQKANEGDTPAAGEAKAKAKAKGPGDGGGGGGGDGGGGSPRGDSVLPGEPQELEYHLGNDETAGVGEFKAAEVKGVDKSCPIHLKLRWPYGGDGTSKNFEKVVALLIAEGSGLERVSRLQICGHIGPEGSSGMKALVKLIESAPILGSLELTFLHEMSAPILEAVPVGLQALSLTMLTLDKKTQDALVVYVARSAAILEKLDMSYCSVDDDLFAKVVDSVLNSTKPALNELTVMSGELADAAAIVKLLQGSAPLRKLFLGGNELNADAAKAIAAACSDCATLDVLNLSQNKLGKTGTDAIIAAAKEHGSLTYVQLHKTGLSKAQKEKVEAGLPDRPTIEIM